MAKKKTEQPWSISSRDKAVSNKDFLAVLLDYVGVSIELDNEHYEKLPAKLKRLFKNQPL